MLPHITNLRTELYSRLRIKQIWTRRRTTSCHRTPLPSNGSQKEIGREGVGRIMAFLVSTAGFCEHGKVLRILLSERLSASQEGLCFMELVILIITIIGLHIRNFIECVLILNTLKPVLLL
jgi:hypothetical protein